MHSDLFRVSVRNVLSTIAALAITFSVATVHAQEREGGPRVRRVIAIGDHPRVDGIRINFRDRDLELVRGMNITMWSPHDDATGVVRGLAIGLPATGADAITGLTIAPLGAGARSELRGVTLAGIGGGSGGDVVGISLGGIGFGAGGNVGGIALGGIGVGAGGDTRGLMVGGIGVGAGGDARGIMIGGVGAGVGGSLRGAAIGGVGVGAGGDMRGVAIGGVGVGSGGTLRGLAVGGVGVGAPELRGLIIAPLVGTECSRAIIIAPILFRTDGAARISGATVSSINSVRGHQTGLAIGLVNYAESMNGLQLGLVNIIRDNPAPYRVLPIANAGRTPRWQAAWPARATACAGTPPEPDSPPIRAPRTR